MSKYYRSRARLNNLIPPGSGYQLMHARRINTNGQIVADANAATGQRHALLLTQTV